MTGLVIFHHSDDLTGERQQRAVRDTVSKMTRRIAASQLGAHIAE
jgi:hypothetical protein